MALSSSSYYLRLLVSISQSRTITPHCALSIINHPTLVVAFQRQPARRFVHKTKQWVPITSPTCLSVSRQRNKSQIHSTRFSINQTVRHMSSAHRATDTTVEQDRTLKCPVSVSGNTQTEHGGKTTHLEEKQQTALPFTDIPGPPGIGQWPIIGTLMLFKPFTKFTSTSTKDMLEDLFQRYGSIIRCQLPDPTVLIREVSDMETVFRSEGSYPKRPSLQLPKQFAVRNKFKAGFNEVQGEAWYKLRAPLTKRLARVDSASYYMANQNEVADDFSNILGNRSDLSPEEIADLFFRFAAESIGVVCFNDRLGFLTPSCMNNEDKMTYLRVSKELFSLLHDEVSGKSIMHRFYRNKTYRKFEESQLKLKFYSKTQLEKASHRLQELQKSGQFDPDKPNLLHSLLLDPGLDDDDIYNLMNTLYVAGTDSTAKNLQTLLYNLATNPEKQDTLYNEIMSVIGPDQYLTPDALSQMPYLKAALKESFRLHCPNTGIARYLPQDVVLNGYVVPAGTKVLICSTEVGKGLFPEPEKYLPERWLRSHQGRQREHSSHPMASMPFGYGPRNCIGRRFAEQEIYLAAVRILQKHCIGIKQESENMTFSYSIFIGPDRPIAFTFTKR